MKILILGATGNIGSRTVKELQFRGIKPRVGVRQVESARKMLGRNVKYVPFDFSDPATFAPALDNITRLFFVAPISNPDETIPLFLEEAAKAGVRHLTFSSGRTTGDIEGKPLNRVEKLVAASGIPYTVLRPGWFMQNFTGWLGGTVRQEGKLYLPVGTAKTAFVDVRDIAAVAAHTLLQNGHAGKTYELTSEEALDHHQVADLISRATGNPTQYIPQARAAFVQTMVERGWTEAAAQHTADLYEVVLTGKEAVISPDVRDILRRTPIRFAQFVQDFRNAWG